MGNLPYLLSGLSSQGAEMLWQRVLLTIGIFFSSPSWSLSGLEEKQWLDGNSAVFAYVQFPEYVERLYQGNHHRLIWSDNEATSQLEFQLELIQTASVSPYFDHQISKLRRYKNEQKWFEYDIVATDLLLSYISYLEKLPQHGKEWLFTQPLSQSLPAPSYSSMNRLSADIQAGYLATFVRSLRSPLQRHQQFANRYSRLLKARDHAVPLFHQVGLLKLGDKLPDRANLIKRLEVVGLETSHLKRDIKYYDTQLELAVKQFQKMHGLTQDGVVGPITLKWLNMTPAQRLHSMALNSERSRLWPEERDLLVLVNVPGYEMKFWYKGEEIFESKVVVGRKSRKTPIMVGKMDGVVLNPVWNVPKTIMVKDILPKVKYDQSFLTKQNIEIIEGWDSQTAVNPQTIDWTKVSLKSFPYKMRQLAGDKNALGLYKFNIPNKRAIFLHDTPSKSLFQEDSRAFSSGCVRVQNADQFALQLLKTQGLEEELSNLATRQEANTMIPLRRRIPVHIIYQTVWFEGEELNYRDDIYQYDLVDDHKG
ncbi:L,D-transpeptidase family protein [Vibrio vulnificus]|nr:murein L,D-transpeptidase [Vibrio vulnificus]